MVKILYEFHESLETIEAAENITPFEIHSLIFQRISQINENLAHEDLDFTYEFIKGSYSDFMNIADGRMKYGKLKKILVQQIINVNIYPEMANFKMKSYETFGELKEKISEHFNLETYKLELENGEKLGEGNEDLKIYKLLGTRHEINFILIDTQTKYYYAFHQNYPSTYQEFV